MHQFDDRRYFTGVFQVYLLQHHHDGESAAVEYTAEVLNLYLIAFLRVDYLVPELFPLRFERLHRSSP